MPDDILTIPAPNTVERFINHVLVSKSMSLLIDEGAPSFSPTILAQFEAYQENHPDISIAMIDCAPEESKKKLTEKQFLIRFYKAVTHCYCDGSAFELISALNSILNWRCGVVPVFVNPQFLGKYPFIAYEKLKKRCSASTNMLTNISKTIHYDCNILNNVFSAPLQLDKGWCSS